jgi:hypothetical protein
MLPGLALMVSAMGAGGNLQLGGYLQHCTPITGLADDNTQGPFAIGFNFPFYGARRHSFSKLNGYMTLGAQP